MGCQQSKAAPVTEPARSSAAGALSTDQALPVTASPCDVLPQLSVVDVLEPEFEASPDHASGCVQHATVRDVAVCFEGGGLKALSAYTGLTTALLAAGKKYKHLEPKLEESGIYAKFGQVSSVSGGTWFAASLIYSERFARLIEDMASAHESAGAQFDKGWTQQWQKQTSGNSKFAESIEDMLRQMHSTFGETAEKALTTLVEMKHFFIDGAFNWTNLTQQLLESTAGISPDLQAGSKDIMSWSRDKLWLVNHVVATPTNGSRFKTFPLEKLPVRTRFFATSLGATGISYAIQKQVEEFYPSFLPAAYTVKLGSGPSHPAPSFYSAIDVPQSQYQGIGFKHSLPCCCCCETSSATSATCIDCGATGHLKYVGQLPVSGLSSASSAAAGWAQCLPPSVLNITEELVGAQFMPFVSLTTEGDAFRQGQDLVSMACEEGSSQKTVDALAKAHVCGLADAGFVDDTGVAGAIARGAKEVVVFLTDEKLTGLTQLFEGRDTSTTTSALNTVNALFGDDHLTVFSQPTASEVREAYERDDANKNGLSIQSLKITNAKHISAMKVGSINCATADAKWFGIVAGQAIKVHFVSVESNAPILFGDFFAYEEFVQEIVDCIMDDVNAPIVSGTMLPMFF